MLRFFALTLFAAMSVAAARAEDGPVTVESVHGFDETVARLTAAIEEKGASVIAVVDHGAGAKAADLPLGPTKLVIFGNPKLGTPLMQSDRLTGLDLPLKILVWSQDGRTKLSYWDPRPLADHYALEGRGEVLAKMSGALKAFTAAAGGAAGN